MSPFAFSVIQPYRSTQHVSLLSCLSLHDPQLPLLLCMNHSVHDECCCECLVALAGGWGCMLMSLLAMQKSVGLLGQVEGIDGLRRGLPSLDRGGDSAAVGFYLPCSAPWQL